MNNELTGTLVKMRKLKESGAISNYKFENVDENGNVGKLSECRNTDRLTIEFPNGEKLVINTFCSGCLEDTFVECS